MSAPRHGHHVDARLFRDGPYIDRALVVSMKPPNHRGLHLVLGDLGLDWPDPARPLLVHRARRHAVTAGWHADAGEPLVYEPKAARALQQFFLDVLDALGEKQ